MTTLLATPDLYDDDILAWSEQQAEALRRLASRPDLSNAVDWANVIEEIESVGRSELRRVEGALRQLCVHLLKLLSGPKTRVGWHWRAEALTFHANARASYTRSMRRRIDLDATWKTARQLADAQLQAYGDQLGADCPESCPFTLDDLLASDFDPDRLIATYHERRREPHHDL